MSALLVDDTGNSAIVDSNSEVQKLQDLVRKLQVQNHMLLDHTENQSADANIENSTYVIDANCNTDLFHSSMPSRNSVLREQQLNSNNTRLASWTDTDTEANDDDSVRGAVSRCTDSFTDDTKNTTEVHSDNSCLDSIQLIDVDGKLSDDEESWSDILITILDLRHYSAKLYWFCIYSDCMKVVETAMLPYWACHWMMIWKSAWCCGSGYNVHCIIMVLWLFNSIIKMQKATVAFRSLCLGKERIQLLIKFATN